MLSQHIALVAEAEDVSLSDVARVSAALQKQVMRDLAPMWGVSASVDPFPRLEDVPAGHWPILITSEDLGMDAGVHLDRDGQPYAQVELSPNWSLDASRACLEMLVNPFGTRSVSATSPRSDQGAVQFLIEVCGPCGDAQRAYAIDNVIVSDFCTPAYFESGPGAVGKRCTFNGSIDRPFGVLQGGHITWFDLVSSSWWRRGHWGENPVDLRLGALERGVSSVRELAPAGLPLRLRSLTAAQVTLESRVEIDRNHALHVSKLRADRLRELVRDLDRARGPALTSRTSIPIALPPPADVSSEEIETLEASEVIESQAIKSEPIAPSKAPPPLPPRSTASSPSIAPVTSMLDRDRRGSDDAASPRAWINWAVLASAAAALVMWNTGQPSPSVVATPLAPASSALVTTHEAATNPGRAPVPQPPAPSALSAAAPDAAIAAPAPAPSAVSAAPSPASSAGPAPAVASLKKSARSSKRASVVSSPPTPPAPAPAEPVQPAPVLVIAPTAPASPAPPAREPKPAPAPQARAALSIDDLIDTRQ